MKEIEEKQEVELDDIKVESFFYVLYFSKDASEMESEFYKDFASLFVDELK